MSNTKPASFQPTNTVSTGNVINRLRSNIKTVVILVAAFCMGLVSCQKEFTLEGGNDGTTTGTQGGTSIFILGGTGGACTEAVLKGDFIKGVAVADTCIVTLSVDVTKTGTWSVATNAINGITFSGSDTFNTTGTHTIQLKAAGTPTAAGTFIFTAGLNGCTFTVACINAPPPPVAEFTLNGAPNACAADSVKGTYYAGTPLDTSNTVTITAYVTKAGTYSITTNTANGIKFSAAGSLDTGVQVITLAGSGTPAATGTNSYTAGANGCSFPVTAVAPTPAVYTLSGAPGACSLATPGGIYQVGVPLTVTNTITVNVDVTTPGVFNIATNTINGITFSVEGKFLAAGTGIPVKLTGTGTPVASGTNNFAIAGTSSCTFDVDVVAALPATYSCKIDGIAFTFTDEAEADLIAPFTSTPYFHTDGYAGPSTGNNVPEFQIHITNNDNSAVQPGTYNVDHILQYVFDINYSAVNTDNSVTIWSTSSSFLTPNPAFSVVITSISGNRAKGTFSGKLTNLFEGSTGTKTVTEGTFDLPIQ